MKSNEQKFQVEIWSDLTCVHCYMAKRNFEKALSQTDFRNEVAIVWRSFELAPGLNVKPRQSMFEFLAEYNRATVEQVKQICLQISGNGKLLGLEYNFDRAIPANTRRAHMLLHMARALHLQNELKEALFKAHFTDGRDIDDVDVLLQIAAETGIDREISAQAIENEKYAEDVKRDSAEVQQKGVKGVPYYLFNSSHSLYGSQDSEQYKAVLERSYNEWKKGKGDADRTFCEIGKEC